MEAHRELNAAAAHQLRRNQDARMPDAVRSLPRPGTQPRCRQRNNEGGSTVPARTSRSRVAAILTCGVTLLASLALAPAALAGKPDTTPAGNFPYTFLAGAPCTNAVVFENTSINARDTVFDPARDGSVRILSRGSAVSRAVDLTTGAIYPMRGGYTFVTTFAADGSFRVD